MLQNDDFFNFIIVSRHIGWSSYRKQNFPSSAIWWLLLLSRLVVSDSLWPHALQHARPPCPSPSHEVCPSSCPLHQWCRPAISSSGALFSSCPQSFQHQGLSQRVCCLHQLTKILELQLQHQSFQWIFRVDFLWDWLVWSCCSRDFQDLLQHHSSKASILWHSAFFMVQLSQPCMTTGKTAAFTIWTFFSKVMYLLFNTLSRFVISSCNSSSPAFLMMCSAYRLNKQGESRQPIVFLS